MVRTTRLLAAILATVGLTVGLTTGLRAQDDDANADAERKAKQAEQIQKILDAAGSAGNDANAPVTKQPAQSDEEAIAITEKFLTAIGGREVLAAVQDRATKFHNSKFSPTGKTEAVIALYIKEGFNYREEWEIKNFKIGAHPLAFVQIYNGSSQEGWVQMFGTISPLEGRTLGVFVWDKYLDDFFMHWKEDGYTLEMAGQGIVDGAIADIVKVVDFSGRHSVRYFFDKESSLLLKKEWIDTTQRQPAKKEQYYKMYRRIAFSDGSGHAINFPLKLEILVDGDLDTERVYSEVKFNSGLDDALFAQPEGVPFEERERLGDDALTLPTALQEGTPPEGSGRREDGEAEEAGDTKDLPPWERRANRRTPVRSGSSDGDSSEGDGGASESDAGDAESDSE